MIDISDSYFAPKVLQDVSNEQYSSSERGSATRVDDRSSTGGNQEELKISKSAGLITPATYHLVFSTNARGGSLECAEMADSLSNEGIEALSEIEAGERQGTQP